MDPIPEAKNKRRDGTGRRRRDDGTGRRRRQDKNKGKDMSLNNMMPVTEDPRWTAQANALHAACGFLPVKILPTSDGGQIHPHLVAFLLDWMEDHNTDAIGNYADLVDYVRHMYR